MKHPNPITSDDSANLFNTASSKAKRLINFKNKLFSMLMCF
ncbi:hypothetical protein PLIP_b0072 [Pseudoalteromonas lipolytica LMEB 39]|nr:hypothetical protein [Pseudoalteromonas lipolytica LMEB 39]